MNSNPTVSVRSLLAALVVLIALTMAYAVGVRSDGGESAAASTRPVAAEADRPAAEPSIVMTGRGEVTAVPDQLAFDVAVTVTRSDVSSALKRANTVTRDVIRALQDQGIARRDLETTGLSINPVYDYTDSGSVLVGYRTTERFGVLVRDLKVGGQAITVAAQTGGNDVRISGVRLQVGDRDGLLAQARAAAVKEAAAKAEQYSDAAGTSLGSVVSVREVSARRPVSQLFRSSDYAELSSASAPVPIRAGSQEASVTVAITWSLG